MRIDEVLSSLPWTNWPWRQDVTAAQWNAIFKLVFEALDCEQDGKPFTSADLGGIEAKLTYLGEAHSIEQGCVFYGFLFDHPGVQVIAWIETDLTNRRIYFRGSKSAFEELADHVDHYGSDCLPVSRPSATSRLTKPMERAGLRSPPAMAPAQ